MRPPKATSQHSDQLADDNSIHQRPRSLSRKEIRLSQYRAHSLRGCAAIQMVGTEVWTHDYALVRGATINSSPPTITTAETFEAFERAILEY